MLLTLWALLALLTIGSGAAHAQLAQLDDDFGLSSPIDCTGLDLCVVQNHFDHDPGPGWTDYACRHLTYDGHTGTDIRVSFDDMQRGVPVLAAADGVVLGLRDGMPDQSIRTAGKEYLGGKYAGNAVYIDHNFGLQTQYNHLKNGSILVAVGEYVHRGQPIAEVGLSGLTEFPHLDLSVLLAGERVDPYIGGAEQGCRAQAAPLWTSEALAMLAYRPRGELNAGFVNDASDLRKLLMQPRQAFSPDQGERMIFWAAVFGPSEGDVMRLSITGPDGARLARREVRVDRDLAQNALSVGAEHEGGWPPGAYRGTCELLPVEPGAEPLIITREIILPGGE